MRLELPDVLAELIGRSVEVAGELTSRILPAGSADSPEVAFEETSNRHQAKALMSTIILI